MAKDFATSLRAATHGNPLVRLQGVMELLCAETQIDVALLNGVDGVTGKHFELVNLGQEKSVVEYYCSTTFTLRCMGFRTQRNHPESILSWGDIPGFIESHTASKVLRPSGFNNGMSVPIMGPKGSVVGVCNVNSVTDYISPRVKETFAALRPVLASLVVDVKQFHSLRLSPRETQILKLIATGMSNREIGDALFISSRTVSTHVEHLLTKLGVSSRLQAAMVAVKSGLITELG